MGGFGSGRTGYATTPDDRDCLKLDVNEFTEVLGEEGRYSGTYSWERDGERSAQIGWRTNDETPEELTLEYTATINDEPREYTCHIRIEHTECNFGGTRPWFQCPLCQDRVAKLYVVPGEPTFACRGCQNFGYASSRASGCADRTLRMRYNRIRKKLGGEPCHPNSMEARTPNRPKGMHEETYEELVRELRMVKEEWRERAFLMPLQRLTGAPPDATEDEML